MDTANRRGKIKIIISMVIFSTIGILRRNIPYSSGLIAFARGSIGAVFLILLAFLRKTPFNKYAIKNNLFLLLLSGAAIGFNWILLFEAYSYTTVAIATLCYYMAPVFVILLAPVVLREKITQKRIICVLLATIGIVLVTGVFEDASTRLTPEQFTGILFGLAAAALYGSVILMNKKMSPIPAYDKTIIQLVIASATLFPYVLLSEPTCAFKFDYMSVILLLVAGIVHTAIAYALYFSSIEKLKVNTVALLSYIDPVLAVVLSAVVLKEPMRLSAIAGAVLVLGASFVSE